MASHTVYAVASGKGGVGKTATTVNLGASLAAAGYTVAIVDTDLGMANLGGFAGLGDEGPTLHEVLAGEVALEEAVYESFNGLAVVPSGISLNGFANVETEAMADVVNALRDTFDYVILDLGAGLSHDTVLPLALADAVVLVSTPHPLSIQDTAKTREVTQHLGGQVAGVVLTRAPTPRELDLGEIRKELGLPVLAVIPESEAVPASARTGESLLEHAPEDPATEGYRGLATIVEEESLESAPIVPEVPEPEPEPTPTDQPPGQQQHGQQPPAQQPPDQQPPAQQSPDQQPPAQQPPDQQPPAQQPPDQQPPGQQPPDQQPPGQQPPDQQPPGQQPPDQQPPVEGLDDPESGQSGTEQPGSTNAPAGASLPAEDATRESAPVEPSTNQPTASDQDTAGTGGQVDPETTGSVEFNTGTTDPVASGPVSDATGEPPAEDSTKRTAAEIAAAIEEAAASETDTTPASGTFDSEPEPDPDTSAEDTESTDESAIETGIPDESRVDSEDTDEPEAFQVEAESPAATEQEQAVDELFAVEDDESGADEADEDDDESNGLLGRFLG